MILVDTSIWIDHLHRSDSALVQLLDEDQVSAHPMVIGELALGSIRDRKSFLATLADLPRAPVASHDEVMTLVDAQSLHRTGLSLVDAHLLASARLAPGFRLWARDRRLRSAAERLGVGAEIEETLGY